MYLSWVIPCYNEEKVIEKTVREAAGFLRGKQFDYEVIVVDNNSTDHTKDIVTGLQREFPFLRLVETKERGKGGAVQKGMLAAKGEVRLFSDADNSTAPRHFDIMEPYLHQGYDVVIGSIEVPGAVIDEHAQWYRRALGRFSKYVIRALSGLWEIHDSQRGFKMFSQHAAAAIFPKLTIQTWGFDIEVLLIAKRHGLKIKEVPVEWHNPAGSRVGLSAYISTFQELLRIMLNDWRGKYSS